MSDSTFRAGGLASGLDTNSIVEQLVALESRPIDQVRTRQSNIKTQISALADIASKLSALATAAKDLGKDGVFATKAVSTNTSFSAVPGSDAVPGRYQVQVLELAKASKWRSDPLGFASGDRVQGGDLHLTLAGVTYGTAAKPIRIADGATLSDVAFAIRQSGAPVSAVVLSDGTKSYLSVTSRDTGYRLDQAPGDALSITFDTTGTTGKPLGMWENEAAVNASVEIDGITFARTSNTISDALPGAALTLAKKDVAEDLVLATDVDATRARLQKFVDAYNDVAKLVQRQLAVTKATNRSTSLAGESAVRALQASLQRIGTTQVPGLTSVKTLADLGVKTGRDGSLSIDATAFEKALSRDPAAVNALFATAGSGLAAVVDDLVTVQTRSSDGVLTSRQDSLNRLVTQLDGRAETMQRRVDAFRDNLVRQFTAMEKAVGGLKSIGTFLTNWQTSQSSSK